MITRVILFDVIETLFSLAPLKDRFVRNGATGESAGLFFAQLLRDAFALSAAGVFKPFPEIAWGHEDLDLWRCSGLPCRVHAVIVWRVSAAF